MFRFFRELISQDAFYLPYHLSQQYQHETDRVRARFTFLRPYLESTKSMAETLYSVLLSITILLLCLLIGIEFILFAGSLLLVPAILLTLDTLDDLSRRNRRFNLSPFLKELGILFARALPLGLAPFTLWFIAKFYIAVCFGTLSIQPLIPAWLLPPMHRALIRITLGCIASFTLSILLTPFVHIDKTYELIRKLPHLLFRLCIALPLSLLSYALVISNPISLVLIPLAFTKPMHNFQNWQHDAFIRETIVPLFLVPLMYSITAFSLNTLKIPSLPYSLLTLYQVLFNQIITANAYLISLGVPHLIMPLAYLVLSLRFYHYISKTQTLWPNHSTTRILISYLISPFLIISSLHVITLGLALNPMSILPYAFLTQALLYYRHTPNSIQEDTKIASIPLLFIPFYFQPLGAISILSFLYLKLTPLLYLPLIYYAHIKRKIPSNLYLKVDNLLATLHRKIEHLCTYSQYVALLSTDIPHLSTLFLRCFSPVYHFYEYMFPTPYNTQEENIQKIEDPNTPEAIRNAFVRQLCYRLNNHYNHSNRFSPLSRANMIHYRPQYAPYAFLYRGHILTQAHLDSLLPAHREVSLIQAERGCKFLSIYLKEIPLQPNDLYLQCLILNETLILHPLNLLREPPHSQSMQKLQLETRLAQQTFNDHGISAIQTIAHSFIRKLPHYGEIKAIYDRLITLILCLQRQYPHLDPSTYSHFTYHVLSETLPHVRAFLSAYNPADFGQKQLEMYNETRPLIAPQAPLSPEEQTALRNAFEPTEHHILRAVSQADILRT